MINIHPQTRVFDLSGNETYRTHVSLNNDVIRLLCLRSRSSFANVSSSYCHALAGSSSSSSCWWCGLQRYVIATRGCCRGPSFVGDTRVLEKPRATRASSTNGKLLFSASTHPTFSDEQLYALHAGNYRLKTLKSRCRNQMANSESPHNIDILQSTLIDRS